MSVCKNSGVVKTSESRIEQIKTRFYGVLIFFSFFFLMVCLCCCRAPNHRIVFRLCIAKKKELDATLLTRSISVRNCRKVATHEHWALCIRRKHKNLSLLLWGCQLTACSTLYFYSRTLNDSSFIDARAAHTCANVHVFRQWFVPIVDIFIIPLYVTSYASSHPPLSCLALHRWPTSSWLEEASHLLVSVHCSCIFICFRLGRRRNGISFDSIYFAQLSQTIRGLVFGFRISRTL